jgi:hypothetical protein
VAPLSWQSEQLPVTPAWIIPDVGAGSLNWLPDGNLAELPGTKVDGIDALWQSSQVVDVFMWLPAVMGGITTMLVIPWNPVTLGPWHSAQLLVIALWLKAEPLNVGVPVTGICKTLELAPTWQLSQPRPRIGTWLSAGPTTVRLAMV